MSVRNTPDSGWLLWMATPDYSGLLRMATPANRGSRYPPQGPAWPWGNHLQDFLSPLCRCNRLRCPLARMSGLQCFNMGHNGHGINLHGVSMTPMEN